MYQNGHTCWPFCRHHKFGGSLAGTAIRCRLAKRAQNTTDGSAKKLEQALRIVSRSITEVNESAEEHSLAIEKKKKEFLRLLEEDEKQNIESVDSQRWGKLKILEKQEQGLKASVAMMSRVIELVTESSVRLTDAELLEMSVAFEHGLFKADSESLECRTPEVSSTIRHKQSWDRIAPTSPPAPDLELRRPTVQKSQSKGMYDSHTCQPSRSRRDSPALETKTRRPARRPKKADSSRFVPINAQNHDFKPAFACSLCSSVGIQVSSVFWPFFIHPSVAGSFVRSYLYGICAYASKLCPSAFAGRVRHATVQVYHFRPWAVGRGRCLS